MNKDHFPVNIPLDYDFGYLIGAYLADGCLTDNHVLVAKNDSEYFKPIENGVINMELVIGTLLKNTIILTGKMVELLDYVLILQSILLNIIVENFHIISIYIQLFYKLQNNSIKD